MSADKCLNCDNTELVDSTYLDSVAVGGRLFEEELPARVCPLCKWGYVKRTEFSAFEKRVAKALLDSGVRHRAAESFIDRVDAEKKKKAKRAEAVKAAKIEAKAAARVEAKAAKRAAKRAAP